MYPPKELKGSFVYVREGEHAPGRLCYMPPYVQCAPREHVLDENKTKCEMRALTVGYIIIHLSEQNQFMYINKSKA